jgi:hypothetical protein
VDAIPERLEKAGELGAVPINFLRGDPVEQIREQQAKWRSGPAFRQESPLGGVSCAIDAIGFQARSKTDYTKEDPLWVTEAIAELINPAGRVAIIGVWPAADPNGVLPSLKEGKLMVPWSKLFNKNVTIVMGRDDGKRWNRKLRDMIINGAAKPSRVVSHRLALDQAPEAFANFMRMLAPPAPAPDTPSTTNGRATFIKIGCSHCRTPSFTTGKSTASGSSKVPSAALSNQKVVLWSDLLVHHMGKGLADGITQGSAGPDEFRTAPLWGLGQRVFFLHDGRTMDLLEAIEEHKSSGSEADKVVDRFNKLKTQDKQDILNFLRAL